MPVTLLGAAEIREIADELDLKPTKTLGQNFVIDPNVCQKIVRLANVGTDDHVVEIGPGLGSLTLALLQACSAVTAIEIDTRLAGRLPVTAAAHGVSENSLTVINADALAIHHLDNQPTRLVANLPYNVSVPVFLTFLERFESIKSGVVMVQTEVAERLTARPGNKIYGAPSAKARWWCDLELADTVSRSIFWPIPNVDSSLVSFTRHAPIGDESERRATFDVIDRAFGQRRKMLRSVLADLCGGSSQAEEILVGAGIEGTTRGESLTIEQFVAIARVLNRRK